MDWKIFLSLTGLFWGICNSLWTRHLVMQSVRRQEIKDLSIKSDKMADRLIHLEGGIVHIPSKDLIHRIEKHQIALEGNIKTLNESVQQIQFSLRRMENFWLSTHGKTSDEMGQLKIFSKKK